MAKYFITKNFLNNAPLGIFGSGHLGMAIAVCLLNNGFPNSQLMLCHGKSIETEKRLQAEKLSQYVTESSDLTKNAKIIFYLVRPQSVEAIEKYTINPDALFVSFLAGVSLARIPIHNKNRYRIMTSAPSTIFNRNAIAGIYPDGNNVMQELLKNLGIWYIPLQNEDDIHAFTVYGPCLPIIFCYWHARGGIIDDKLIVQRVKNYGLEKYDRILQWAHKVEPSFKTKYERDEYFRKSATPGGVTQAIIENINLSRDIIEALEKGVERSKELSMMF